MKKLVIILVFIIIPSVLAWSADTHKYITEEWYNAKYADKPECLEWALNGTVMADAWTNKQRHHCYYTCIADTYSWCEDEGGYCEDCSQGSVTDCPARDEAIMFFEYADSYTDCMQWQHFNTDRCELIDYPCQFAFAFGWASHHVQDGGTDLLYWHRVKGESTKCHSNFERSVERMIENGYPAWEVINHNYCGDRLTKTELDSWVDASRGWLVEDKLVESAFKASKPPESPIPRNTTQNGPSTSEGDSGGFFSSFKPEGLKAFITPMLVAMVAWFFIFLAIALSTQPTRRGGVIFEVAGINPKVWIAFFIGLGIIYLIFEVLRLFPNKPLIP